MGIRRKLTRSCRIHENVAGGTGLVATFYNMIFRKPVGRHVILVCDSISCWVMGYENILAHLTNQLEIKLEKLQKMNGLRCFRTVAWERVIVHQH